MSRDDRWPYRFKQRVLVFLRKDEAIFSEALRERFPHVAFVGDTEDRIYDSILSAPGHSVSIIFPEGAGWHPIPAFDPVTGDRNGYVDVSENRWLVYFRGQWDWNLGSGKPSRDQLTYDPPTPMWGNIQGSYNVLDPEKETVFQITRKVWRIIERIATNRVKFGHPLGSKLEGRGRQLMADAKGHAEWFGHSALEWCRDGIRSGERRMLCATRRPADDWEVPRDPWYQALRRRVEDMYGDDLHDPPRQP
jgi:hypothetical protein